ncbi:hypothetical protein [Pontibacillus yanchengensis]|uniref:Uncharacterized protein n=1 Tax=Pontibacillus yanchengensis Y32 TaxID=1385514 RepID=A0A0A2T9W0_9BACI|nr:hypothetical protein [Pontibacillus yanchengensis]KGP72617.1 hypothetical protein N782_11480 [Pontibacillus yanchengensis Y32]
MNNLLAISFSAILFFTGCGVDSSQDTEGTTDSVNSQTQNEDKMNEDTKEESNTGSSANDSESNAEADAATLDKGRAQVILEDYEKAFKMVINNTNDQQKLNEYSTKQELQEHFEHFMSTDRANSFVNTYFRVEDDGLYVKAMGGPTFLLEDEAFSFEKVSNQQYQVIQERYNQQMGPTNVRNIFTLVKQDGIWIVEQVEQEEISGENENTSPDNNESNIESKTLNKAQATRVLEEYETAFKKVVNYTNDEGIQQEYTTKEGLQTHFEHFVAPDIAASLVDTYFRVENGNVYVEAKGGPLYLNENNPYQFSETANGMYKITQEIDNQLRGHIQVEFVLSTRNTVWVIEEINTTQLD